MAQLMEARVPDIGSDQGVPVIELLVKVGDVVSKDQGLVTLESDKATMEVPAPFAGTVREVLVKVGDEIGTGAVVAMIEASTEAAVAPVAAKSPPAVAAPAIAVAVAAASPVAKPAAPAATAAPAAASSPRTLDSESLVPGVLPYASPAVRVFARELGVDLSQVKGTERSGRIGKADVQAFVKSMLAGGNAVGEECPTYIL